MKRLFGTDGIRGVANQYPMTAEVALSLGRALGFVFGGAASPDTPEPLFGSLARNESDARSHPRVLIGKDTRLSGYMIETALASGICSLGGDPLLVGPMPTPAVAFLTQAMRVDAGVMISASHNPFQDNGIKLFDRYGFKLPDELEEKIEHLVLSGEIDNYRPTADRIGKAARVEESKGRYIEFLKSTFPRDRTLEGLKVVLDCAHGATYMIAPIVFEELGGEVTLLGASPDGRNINDGVGAVHPERMAERVRETGADLGIAFDGDGDRAVFADEKGRVVDGDAILVVCAEELIRRGALRGNTVVATVMSNQAVDEYMARCGGKVIRARVGDRYVVETMKEKGLNFGGEASGHLVFLDHATTGDGLIAALQVLGIMRGRGLSLSELVSRYRPYPQVTKSVKVRNRKDLSLFPGLQKMIRDFERLLGGKGRLLVRYSGTEPVVRVMIEGHEESEIRRMASDLTSCIEQHLS